MSLSRIVMIFVAAAIATAAIAVYDLVMAPSQSPETAADTAPVEVAYDPGLRGFMQRIGFLPTRDELRRELGFQEDDGHTIVATAPPAPAEADSALVADESATSAAVPGDVAARAPGTVDPALPAAEPIRGASRAAATGAETSAGAPAAPPDDAAVSPGELAVEAGVEPGRIVTEQSHAIPPSADGPSPSPAVLAPEPSRDAGAATVAPEDGSGGSDTALPSAEDPASAVATAARDTTTADAAAVDAEADTGGDDATISLEELAAAAGIAPHEIPDPPSVLDGTAVPEGDAAGPPNADSLAETATGASGTEDAGDDGTISLEELAAEIGIAPHEIPDPPPILDDTAPLEEPAAGAALADGLARVEPRSSHAADGEAGDDGTISLHELAAEAGIAPHEIPIPPAVLDGTGVPGGDAEGSSPTDRLAETAAGPSGAGGAGTVSLEELAAEAGVDPAQAPLPAADGALPPAQPEARDVARSPDLTGGPSGTGAEGADDAAAGTPGASGELSLEALAAEAGVDPSALPDLPKDDDVIVLDAPVADAPAAPEEVTAVDQAPDEAAGAETISLEELAAEAGVDPASATLPDTADVGIAPPDEVSAATGPSGTPASADAGDAAEPSEEVEIAALAPEIVREPAPERSSPRSEETAALRAAVAPPPSDPLVPTYDVLSFQPSGDGMIAGRSAPDAKIELLTGDEVIGETRTGASGDWLIILERPLAQGEHTLTVRATAADETRADGQTIALTIVDGSTQPLMKLLPMEQARN